jgi:hypothetical protein
MTTSTTHAWLRRVSDYHSGGISEVERAAVEAHLATCSECQEALAMYRRFYSLTRSPLTLDAPAMVEGTPLPLTGDRSAGSGIELVGGEQTGPPSPPRRRLPVWLGAVAAVLIVALVAGGFIVVLSPHGGPGARHTATPTVALSPSPQPSTTPTLGPIGGVPEPGYHIVLQLSSSHPGTLSGSFVTNNGFNIHGECVGTGTLIVAADPVFTGQINCMANPQLQGVNVEGTALSSHPEVVHVTITPPSGAAWELVIEAK